MRWFVLAVSLCVCKLCTAFHDAQAEWDVIICHAEHCPRTSWRGLRGSKGNREVTAEDSIEHGREENLKTLDSMMQLEKSLTGGGLVDFASLGASSNKWRALSARHFAHLGMDAIRDPDGQLSSAKILSLARKLPCLCFEPELDQTLEATLGITAVPLDPEYRSQWHLKNAKVDKAWAKFSGATKGMTIAVVDTGGSYHPDLADNLWIDPGNPKCHSTSPQHPSLEPGCYGYDASFVEGDSLAPPMDYLNYGNPLTETMYHGTSVAGMIAARPNNALAGAGVCWGCKILFLKVVDSKDRFTLGAFINAYDIILAKKIKISNHSYTTNNQHKTIREALNRLAKTDHLFVAAAGNTSCDADDPMGADPCFQGRRPINNPHMGLYGHNMTLTVGSVDRYQIKSWFSNWGNTTVDVFAPGHSVYVPLNTRQRGGTLMGHVTGTSFSSPLVAGVAALVWGSNPSWTAAQVKAHIINTAVKTDELQGRCVSGGYVDAAAAVASGPVSDIVALPTTTHSTAPTDFTDLFYKSPGATQT